MRAVPAHHLRLNPNKVGAENLCLLAKIFCTHFIYKHINVIGHLGPL